MGVFCFPKLLEDVTQLSRPLSSLCSRGDSRPEVYHGQAPGEVCVGMWGCPVFPLPFFNTLYHSGGGMEAPLESCGFWTGWRPACLCACGTLCWPVRASASALPCWMWSSPPWSWTWEIRPAFNPAPNNVDRVPCHLEYKTTLNTLWGRKESDRT